MTATIIVFADSNADIADPRNSIYTVETIDVLAAFEFLMHGGIAEWIAAPEQNARGQMVGEARLLKPATGEQHFAQIRQG